LQFRLLNPKSTWDYDFDHIHYCNECKHWYVVKCKHWYVVKQLKASCKLSSAVTSHEDHVESIGQTKA